MFRLPKMSICWRKFALIGTSRSRNQASTAASTTHGTSTKPMLCRKTGPSTVICGVSAAVPSRPKPITHGPRIWMIDMPKLPTPAWVPSAVPDFDFGKK